MSSVYRYFGDPPYALWSIWHQISPLQHWLVYTLCALCVYSGYCVVSTIVRLHSVKHLGADAASRCMAMLRGRCANLRHAIVTELYLSGIVIFVSFQFIPMYLMGNDVESQMLAKFLVDSAFATNVLAVFLILHLAQWFLFNRISAYSERTSDDPSSPNLA
jgi:hypothetical protein